MRIAVLGAGALGSLFGGLLSRQHEVTLICRPAHAKAINAQGLRITGASQLVCRPRAVTKAGDAGVPELLLVTTKAYDTAGALVSATPILGAETAVLTLQNGLSNLDEVMKAVGIERAIGGVTTHGTTLVEPGHILHAGAGYTRIGTLEKGPLAGRVAAVFTDAGIETEATDDIQGELWAKAIVNAAINPLTAITGLRNGALLQEPGLAQALERACREAIAVADASGVRLPPGDLVERTRTVARLTGENKSSMLQDVERGRRTEIDAIVGTLVALGKLHEAATPTLSTLLSLVHGIERTTRRD